ncbi:Pectinesterase inhibitor domain containing protein [Parasponia andersonii]|uniref:Pectinesterase inhibitor domain containing protein n=1 Tax=Parasponia andersonii TaxID=3476 RepID=A0A2P5CYB8_PARAD|nr:Pectinesterase inhibitor domain containing protein [Parasponia andersonii]
MSLLPLILLSLALLSQPHSVAARRRGHDLQAPSSDLVRTSCVHANYPNLCLRTLSAYSGPARTPRDLAQAAVNVSLDRAKRVSKYLARTAFSYGGGGSGGGGGGSKRQRAALGDCVEQISDSVEELTKTLAELQHLRWETFRWQMSNAQTWVSAALTNEDTCLDGFQGVDGGGKLKADVKRKITNLARITSNALYMINRLDETRGRS